MIRAGPVVPSVKRITGPIAKVQIIVKELESHCRRILVCDANGKVLCNVDPVLAIIRLRVFFKGRPLVVPTLFRTYHPYLRGSIPTEGAVVGDAGRQVAFAPVHDMLVVEQYERVICFGIFKPQRREPEGLLFDVKNDFPGVGRGVRHAVEPWRIFIKTREAVVELLPVVQPLKVDHRSEGVIGVEPVYRQAQIVIVSFTAIRQSPVGCAAKFKFFIRLPLEVEHIVHVIAERSIARHRRNATAKFR